MPIKSIFKNLPDKTLARIARIVATKKGKIVLDEDTIAFLYARAKASPVLYVVDSDYNFMRLDGKLAGRGQPVLTAAPVYKGDPRMLAAIDPASCQKQQAAGKDAQTGRPGPL